MLLNKKGNKMIDEKCVVCEEIINDKPSRCYTIRVESDCCPSRFIKLGTFDTYEEAEEFEHQLWEQK